MRSSLTVLGTLLLVGGFVCLFAALWYLRTYGDTGFDSILFTLFSDLGGVETDLILDLLLEGLLPALVCAAVVAILIFWEPRFRIGRVYPLKNGLAFLLAILVTLALIGGALVITGGHLYIYDLYHESAIFDEKYVDPDSVEITFPEEKRNLVYIFLESMETTYFDKAQGGALDKNLIPELYDLAQQNLNFSESASVGGAAPAVPPGPSAPWWPILPVYR